MDAAAGIVGIIGFGFQLCSTIDGIINSYRSAAQDLSLVSSNLLTLCDVLSLLDTHFKKQSDSTSIHGGSDLSLNLADPIQSESQACLKNVLDKCWACLLDIQRLVEPFRNVQSSVIVKFKWLRKRGDIKSVMTNLESCKGTLSMALLVLRYCADEVSQQDVALAIQRQAEQLKSEKDENYAYVMQRYLDCASTTICSPRASLEELIEDAKSICIEDSDNDGSSILSYGGQLDEDADPLLLYSSDESDQDSFHMPISDAKSNRSHSSLLSLGVYTKVCNDRSGQQRRKKANRDSGCVMEDDSSSTYSRNSSKWKPFTSLTYKLDWYKRTFRPDINGRIEVICGMVETSEATVQELLDNCKNYAMPRPSSSHSGSSQQSLKGRRSRDLRNPDENFFRHIVRIQKSLVSLNNLHHSTLNVLTSTNLHSLRSSPSNFSKSSKDSSDSETPLKPYLLDILNTLLKVYSLIDQLHTALFSLTKLRDESSHLQILSRLTQSRDNARLNHTERTFANITAKLQLQHSKDRFDRAEELWQTIHHHVNSALASEFFFFDDLDRILSTVVEEPVAEFSKSAFDSELLDTDVNRAYSALVASAERQRGYTLLDHQLRSILLGARTSLSVEESKRDLKDSGKKDEVFDILLRDIQIKEDKEKENLEAVFKYLYDYVGNHITGTMNRLEPALVKFGERLYIPLSKSRKRSTA